MRSLAEQQRRINAKPSQRNDCIDGTCCQCGCADQQIDSQCAAIRIDSNPRAIIFQVRREVPTEIDMAAAFFKAAVVLTPADALAVAGELLSAAAAQLKNKAKVVSENALWS